MTRKNSGDERTRSNANELDRAPRDATAERPRSDDTSLMSDEELVAFMRNEFMQEALPTVPAPPGMHYCWLTTTSSYDPIHKRMRMGYKPVLFSELISNGQGEIFAQYKFSGAEQGDVVRCNEMQLFKLPQRIYQLMMQEMHHNAPLREEEAIHSAARPEQESKSTRARIDYDKEDEGMKTIVDDRPVPSFA